MFLNEKQTTALCEVCNAILNSENTSSVNGICNDCEETHDFCVICNNYTIITNIEEVDGHDYCDHCKDDETFFCADCGDLHSVHKKEKNNNGESICDSCRDNYYSCEQCDDIIHSDDSVYIESEGTIICEDCRDHHYTMCNYCGEYVGRYDTTTANNREYCESCIEDNFYYCDNCDEYHDNDDGCPAICESLHNYGYKPEANFYKEPNQKKETLFFGFELEIETDDMSSLPDYIENLNPQKFYCKEDGSLNDGFEIVSHPMTFEYIKNREVLSLLRPLENDSDYSADTNKNTGMHIHMSRKAFGTIHLYKFLKFFYDQDSDKLLHHVAGRSDCEYCSKYNSERKNALKKVKNKDDKRRYTYVNLQNKETIEIRVFQGTKYEKVALKNIEFCKALFEFTKCTSIQHITNENFKMYVIKHKKTYKNLAENIKSLDI